MVNQENALQYAEVCKWIADGECEITMDSGLTWKAVSHCTFGFSPECYRRRPRKVTRPMTIDEVIALGHFVRRCNEFGDGFYYQTGLHSNTQAGVNEWFKNGTEYTTDGGKTWNHFTVEEEAK